jgi:hypothetical protein
VRRQATFLAGWRRPDPGQQAAGQSSRHRRDQGGGGVFRPRRSQGPSLYRGPDGTWGIAYGSEKLGNKHIFFASSKDGASWTPAAAVQAGGLTDIEPALNADSRGYHDIFSSNREVPTWALYVSDLTGTGWSAPEKLNVPGSLISEPAITATSHGWALTYRCTDGLVVAESADGHNWFEAKVAGTHLGDPAIAQIGDRLTIVAHRSAQLFEISRPRFGGTWTAAKPLGIRGEAIQPALAVDAVGSYLAFGWREDGSDDSLQLALSTRSEGGWGAPEALTSGSDDNVNPTLQILPDGGRALAWGIYQAAGARGIVFASLAASQGRAPESAYFPGGKR